MKLYLLRPVLPDECETYAGPFGFDTTAGVVVRAETEAQAREIAQRSAEKDDRYPDVTNPWLDRSQTTCVVLLSTGDAGVILRDFRAS